MRLDRLGLIYDEYYICNNEYAIVKDDGYYKIYNNTSNSLDGSFDDILYSNVISILSKDSKSYLVDSNGTINKLGDTFSNTLMQGIELMLNNKVLDSMMTKKHLVKKGLIDIKLNYTENKKYIDIKIMVNKDSLNPYIVIGKYNTKLNKFDIKPSETYVYEYYKNNIEVLSNTDKHIISLYGETIIKDIDNIDINIESDDILIFTYTQYGIQYLISIIKRLKKYKTTIVDSKCLLITPYNIDMSYNIGFLLKNTGKMYMDKQIYSLYSLETLHTEFNKVIILEYSSAYRGIIEIGIIDDNDKIIKTIKFSRETLEIL